MKKIFASVVAVLLLVMSFANVAMADEAFDGNLGKTYTAGKATVTVDGVVDEIWAAVPAQKIDVPYNEAYPNPNFDYLGTDVEFKVLYDDNNIYVLIVAVNADIFGGDVLEIYIDEGEPMEGGYGEFAYQSKFSYDADYPEDGLTILSGGSNGTEFVLDEEGEIIVSKALSLSDDKKTATIEVAYKRLNAAVKEGDTIGLEFMYEDKGTLGGAIDLDTINIFRWNICEVDENGDETGIVRPWQETYNFGKLVLGPTAEVATAIPAPTDAPTNDTTGDTEEEPNNTWIYVVAGVVVVAAVVAAVVVVSKKKN